MASVRKKQKPLKESVDHEPDPPLINKTLVSILGIASLALIPVAIYVTMAYLHTDHLNLRGLRFVITMVWMAMNVMLLGPVAVVGLLPAFARFAYGPPQFRRKWLTLQLIAWIGSLFFAAIGLGYWMGSRNRALHEAAVFHAIPTAAFAFALYLCVMSFLPAPFFDEDRMGQRVKQFLGVQETKSVPLVCFGAAIALAAIAALMWWVPASTFAT